MSPPKSACVTLSQTRNRDTWGDKTTLKYCNNFSRLAPCTQHHHCHFAHTLHTLHNSHIMHVCIAQSLFLAHIIESPLVSTAQKLSFGCRSFSCVFFSYFFFIFSFLINDVRLSAQTKEEISRALLRYMLRTKMNYKFPKRTKVPNFIFAQKNWIFFLSVGPFVVSTTRALRYR